MKKNLEEMQVKVANKRAILESHDGEEFSPITVAKNVLCEDGTTMQDYFDNHSEPNISTKIVNSNSMSKVGQGDNVDFSDNVVNGAYESMVLKGKSMVNCIQEPSSQDVVLPYEFEEGQYVTINDTKESGALGVELKGQTLVNLKGVISKNPQWVETDDAFCLDLPADNGQPNISVKFTSPLKRNTEYTVFVNIKSYTTGYPHICFMDETNRVLASDREWTPAKAGVLKTKFTTSSTVDAYMLRIIPRNGIDNTYTFSKEFIILEGDYTNVDIPYFEGMASCKMPILHTIGKNLFNPNNVVIDSSNTYGYIDLSKHETLTFSITDKDTSIDMSSIFFGATYQGYDYDGTNQNGGGWLFSNGEFVRSSLTTTQCKYFSFHPCNKATFDKIIARYNIQLEEGSTATPYEPHKSSILSLPEEVVLRSLPNGVCDTFNTRTGVYTQRIGEVTLNGDASESWLYFTNSDENTVRCQLVKLDSARCANTETNMVCDKLKVVENSRWRNDEEQIERGHSDNYISIRILKSKLSSETLEGLKIYLQTNPITVQYELATPIIAKINLPSTLKSWNTTTHFYSEIPENSLYPILSHSNPTYPVIIKPSTKYSIVANSYSNGHTNSAINFNLGGATVSTTVGNRVTTITTPSTLSNELLTMSGRGNKLNNVMVIEGDVVGDEPYFEGICDCKSPILSNIGETILETPFEKEFGTDAQKEFFRIVDCAEIFDNFGVGKQYTLSLDIKANKSGAARIYLQNGSGSRHNFSFDIPVTTEYVRHTKQITPTMAGDGHNFKESWLACFTTYNTGCFATIKNIRISTGEDEPYKSNILSCETYFDETTQSDKTIVLRSLPNGVCDTLNVKTGEYVQNIGEVVLDGSEDGWGVSIGNPNINYPTFTNNSIMQDVVNINSGNYRTLKPLCNKYSSYSQTQLFNVADSPTPVIKGIAYRWDGYGLGVRDDDRFNYDSEGLELFKQSLAQNPITVQYELAKPITKTVDISGYPYAYENGHVLLESGSQEQSLTPTIEYSIVANRGGQIRSNQRMVERHQKKLDSLYAMTLVNMIDSQYKQVLMKLKSELGSEVRTWDIE